VLTRLRRLDYGCTASVKDKPHLRIVDIKRFSACAVHCDGHVPASGIDRLLEALSRTVHYQLSSSPARNADYQNNPQQDRQPCIYRFLTTNASHFSFLSILRMKGKN
jgi:hypothetical protein